MNLRLLRQNDRGTCGACGYVTLLDGLGIKISEKQACDEVNTTKEGTYISNVYFALKRRGIDCNLVNLNLSIRHYPWLPHNSKNRILYLACEFTNQGKRGRPSKDYHAIVVSNGLVYDSAYQEVVPIEAYTFKYNKDFVIKEMILVELSLTNRG